MLNSRETCFHKTIVKDDGAVVKGYDFNNAEKIDYEAILDSFYTTGIQCTEVAKALKQVDQMLSWSLADEPIAEDEEETYKDIEARKNVRCTVWLSYTSNMISSGCREAINFMVRNKMVQVINTTTGGIEEDFVKCLADHQVGSFTTPGDEMRAKGLNRIGNMLVANDNYSMFEEWIAPIIDAMHDEQERDGVVWTPCKIIHRLGKEINNEDSVYYWAYKHNIPVFCPGITDGSIGDMFYFHSYKRPGFIIDIVGDVRHVDDIAIKSRKAGAIIIGGSTPKHHCLNANMMRNGLDYCVYINTGQAYDASDSGATPDEAVSWGKIKPRCVPVKVYSEATLVFPWMVAKCFASLVKSGKWGDRSMVVFEKFLTEKERAAEQAELDVIASRFIGNKAAH
jgi:deoxyhypusine synthase